MLRLVIIRAVMLVALFAPCGLAQVESGTVVVIGYSKKKVVIAADSRETNDEGAYRDTACKIAALTNTVIFVAAGQAKRVRGHVAFWDAIREARTALADTHRLDSDKIGDFLDRVAGRWGVLLGTNIAQNIDFGVVRNLFDGQVLVDAMFIGLDESQELHISHEIIRAKITEEVQIQPDAVKVVTIPSKMIFRALGEGDISDEFEFGRSTRSKQWKHKVPQFAEVHGIAKDTAEAMLRVELTGTYGSETIPRQPEIHYVGGRTDAVELKRNGLVHWIQRKSECPEN